VPLLVRVPNWLGDVMMSLPAVTGLAGRFPGTALWSHPRVADLLGLLFPGTEVIGIDRTPRGFDRVLLLTDSWSSAWKAFRTGASERMGRRSDLRGMLLTSSIGRPAGRTRHHSEDYTELAVLAGAGPAAPDLSLVEPSGEPHVALFPGARYGPAKRWGGFGGLAALLSAESGLPVVVYGTRDESAVLGAVVSESGGTATAVSGLTPGGLARRISSARLAVGNDSGGVHLAAALGVPTLTIFGSTSPVWTAPLGPRTGTIAAGLECSPCFGRKCRRGEPAECLAGITVSDVAAACTALGYAT
jgi:heptosyltransferase-2